MVVAVTTLERVKRRLGQSDPTLSDTTTANLDAIINAQILAVTDAFERYLDLPLTQATLTEVHSIDDFQTSLWLKNYFGQEMPVPTVSSVKIRSAFTTDWGDVTALDSGTYALSTSKPGKLFYSGGYLPAGEDTVQVVLATCGFAADTTAFLAAFPAIADAADSQIVYEYNRRKDPGKTSMSAQGATSTEPEVKLLSLVEERLRLYRKAWI